jgi:hypothetical protein
LEYSGFCNFYFVTLKKLTHFQPVPQLMEEVTEGNSAINEIMTVDQVKQV